MKLVITNLLSFPNQNFLQRWIKKFVEIAANEHTIEVIEKSELWDLTPSKTVDNAFCTGKYH